MKPNGPGDQHGREHLDRVVERQHRVVVDLARDGDLVLGVLQLLLEIEEVGARLQVGVGLRDREEPSERLAEDAFGRRGLGRALRACRCCARLGDGLERAALVGGVALDRLDEVRDQVAAPLELHLDLGPRVVDAVALLDEAVVQRDHVDHEQHDDDEDSDQDPGHERHSIGSAGPRTDVVRLAGQSRRRQAQIMSSSPR